MAKAQQPEKVSFGTRLKQIGMVVKFTAKRDPWFTPWAIVAAVVPVAVAVVLFLVGLGWFWLAFIPFLLILGPLVVLNLRSQKAYLKEAENQPGAAASIIENMRGDWRVTPAVASNTQMDMVHLVLARKGVILIGEGNPSRVRGLITQEKRRLTKVIGNADLRDFHIGTGEGQVPLGKLRMTLMKLPNSISGKDVNALDKRLTALSARPNMPKGAIPKNMRPPKGAFRAMRGR